MSKVMLRGYYGAYNTGDDAFLAVSAWGAKKFLGCDEILVAAGVVPDIGILAKPIYPNLSYRGMGIVNQVWDAWYGKNLDWTVFGGGSYFQDARHTDRMRTVIDKLSTGKCAAVGVSIGPFKTIRDEKACSKFLSSLQFVGVRDKASFERIKDIAPDVRAELTFDLAPLLLNLTKQEMKSKVGRKGLGIALCNYERFSGGDTSREEERVNVVARTIRKCAQEGTVREIVLIDFNGHPTMGDYEVHNTLAGLIKDCVRVEHVRYTNNPLKVLDTISKLDGILAMRLHAAVFGFCTETPVLNLAYHEKCKEWAEMIGHPSSLLLSTEHLEDDLLIQHIGRLFSEENKYPILSKQEALKSSQKNWDWIK